MGEHRRQAMAKRQGRNAAREWLATATTGDKVGVAGCGFQYGYDTLDELRKEGLDVPSSDDPDFSWGFFKQVKGHVYHKVHFGMKGVSDAKGQENPEASGSS